MPRVALVVMDSVGVGALPDADAWGDAGSDTLGHIVARTGVRLPNLAAMGLGRVKPLPGAPAAVRGAWGRMVIAGAGKDTVAGHWEIAGCRVDQRFQTYEQGFPPELMAAWSARTGSGWLGNVSASGTEIIERLGAEHLATRKPIVYTSADSVFQIAAHEDVLPVPDLYALCERTFALTAEWGVARVIARPFVGVPGAFVRTERRHDYAMQPPRPTVMDHMQARGVPTTSIGKIKSIYGDRGFSRQVGAGNNGAITQAVLDALDTQPFGLIFANLVDFDMLYGHRRDPEGYAHALAAFDARVPDVQARLRPDDLLLLTADHGNDPTFRGSDHTREYVPVLAWRPGIGDVALGTRATLADAGATAAEWLGVPPTEGTSFAGAL